MKRFFVVALAAIVVISFSATAFAQDEGGTTTEDVGTTTEEVVSNAHGILPTNPFYFFKEFGRSWRRFFIFDPVKRAEFDLDVLGEKADELSTVEELDPNSPEAIKKALENYNEGVDRLRENLQKLSDSSNNPNIDKLLEKLDERAAKHNELFNRLMEKHQDIFNNVDEVRARLGETISNLERHRGENEDVNEDKNDDATDTEEVGEDSNDSDSEDERMMDDDMMHREDRETNFGRFCMTLYEPVCGENGKTYPNECFAGIANVEVDHAGTCDTEAED